MELSKEWLVGFIEGEGNFHVQLSKRHLSARRNDIEYYPIP